MWKTSIGAAQIRVYKIKIKKNHNEYHYGGKVYRGRWRCKARKSKKISLCPHLPKERAFARCEQQRACTSLQMLAV